MSVQLRGSGHFTWVATDSSPMLFAALHANMPPNPPLTALPREFRGVWVATVANIDWPSAPGLSNDTMRNELKALFDQCQALNLNAVILQVRPSADAMYASKIEPWSYFLTGQQGKAPDNGYDPLAEAVKEAHRRGLELHAWINPYRAKHFQQQGPLASNSFAATHSNSVYQYGKYLWMDPGDPAVQEQTYKVCMDLVDRYDLDGLHVDDYFYPYPEGGQAFPDDRTYDAYRSTGGTLARDDWRRQNVDHFIQRVYMGIKKDKPWVKFGISPFGIWQPGYPEQIRGFNQYAELYADARKWLREGWCDYFTPQLYWPIDRTAQSYSVLLNWWRSQNIKDRHVWPGLYTSQLDPASGNWTTDEIVNQVKISREGLGTHGTVHFSMSAFRNDFKGINEALKGGAYRDKALVPASPWLSDVKPGQPRLMFSKRSTVTGEPRWVVKIDTRFSPNIRFYAVTTRDGGEEKVLLVSDTPGFTWSLDENVPTKVWITPIDFYGNAGEALEVAKPS